MWLSVAGGLAQSSNLFVYNRNKLMKMNKFIVIMTLSLSVWLGACSGSKNRSENSGETASIDVALPEVDSVVLHKEYPGTLSAHQEVDLVARVNGYLRYSGYDPGSLVKKGTVLFRIEDSQYRDAVNQARARLSTAQATNAYATDQYHAMKKALESDAVSQMDVIQAESAMKESAASIQQAKASLQTALTTLGYCTVTAPFTGHISKSIYSDGAYLGGAGAPVKLATIYNDDYVNAYFSIEDSQYLEMINGRDEAIDYDHIPVTFSEELPHSYTGSLNYMSPEIDSSTGTMKLRVKIENPYGELKSGMYAKIQLPYAVNPKAILVKDASIGTDQLGKYLYVVNDSNKVRYTPIEVGELVNDTMRIVTNGITPQSRYVTKALLKVRDGMPVKPVLTK